MCFIWTLLSYSFHFFFCKYTPGASVIKKNKGQTSIGWNVSDPVVVHPGFWNNPVNSGRCVSDVREADTRRWAQIWNKTEQTKTWAQRRFPYLVEHEFSVSTNWVKQQMRRDTRGTGTSPRGKKRGSWNSVRELSLSDKRDLSRLCLMEEDSSQPAKYKLQYLAWQTRGD